MKVNLSGLACLFLTSVGALLAQPNSIFTRGPADVEASLRARITGFFEAQQQGKWRQAEKFVAEDSIDAFLERDKTRYKSFEIREIKWVGEGFKEASVLMIVPFEMSMLGVGTIDGGAPWPITHNWKFEEGDWFWYRPNVDPCAPIDSPLGKVIPECKDGKPVGDTQVDAQRALQRMVESSQVKPEMLQNRVAVSTSQVRFAFKAAAQQSVTITNNFDGPVTLELIGGQIVGLKLSFDGSAAGTPGRTTLDAKKAATLRLSYEPTDTRPPDRLGMQVRVDPLGTMLPIDVVFEGN